ncbi:MAG: Rrf2 family transcriptional regulator [Candidatus Margulisbacteria bacterium]|nr:Rrf2 family transcriptional regulator [Candidatus Margulisiibacteriota bacterium]
MKVSTKLRYGLKFLIYLGANQEGKNITLKEVTDKENISIKYLEQIVTILRPLNILNSTRGNNGGYSLSKPPKEIFLYDIFNTLQGEFFEMNCVETPTSCNSSSICPTRGLWVDMKHLYVDYLKEKTIQDLINNYKRKV